MTSTLCFEDFPSEIVSDILGSCDTLRDLVSFSSTCRRFRSLYKARKVQYLAKTVEQRCYDAVLLGKPYDPHAEPQDDPTDPRSWAINHSIRVSKGRSFFLTKSDLVVGSLCLEEATT